MTTKNNTKSPSKFDEARAAARAKDEARAAGEAAPTTEVVALAMPTEAAAEIHQLTSEEIQAVVSRALAEDGATMAPQLLALKVGQSVAGTLERGPGAELEKEDPRTKDKYIEQVPNWIITTKNRIRFALLETSQLKTKLPPYEGGHVTIIRGNDFDLGGKRCTEYIVIGKEDPMRKRQTIPTIVEVKS